MEHSAEGPSDAVLIARVLAGNDAQAFATLIRRHQSPVRVLLRRLANGDDALADDLAQETFLQAYRKLAQFRSDARFSTWLYRIAYNSFLMQVRSRKPEETLDENGVDEDPGRPDRLAPEQGRADLQIDLRRAMAQLSIAERAAITQCYYLDMSHEEAAFALDCPVGTVKSHILRAKIKLKNALRSWEHQVV